MKQFSKLLAVNIFILIILLPSCQKDTDYLVINEEEATLSAQSKRPVDPGFADNNMVMDWNNKTAIVLGGPLVQPNRTRFFAIIEIAVHNVLNSIKPKYERYAFTEREQHADPDAAVASAAYWAITGLSFGSPQVDTWYDESLATIPDGESK